MQTVKLISLNSESSLRMRFPEPVRDIDVFTKMLINYTRGLDKEDKVAINLIITGETFKRQEMMENLIKKLNKFSNHEKGFIRSAEG